MVIKHIFFIKYFVHPKQYTEIAKPDSQEEWFSWDSFFICINWFF